MGRPVHTFTRNSTATRLQIRARVIVALLLHDAVRLEAAPAAAAAAAAAASTGHADQTHGLGPDELDAGDHLVAEPLEETLRAQGMFEKKSRLRTGGFQGNKIHSSNLWTLGITKL